MIRAARGTGLLCLALGAAAPRLTAQEAIHVRAPLVDYAIAGDTAANRVRLVATLSMMTWPAPSDEARLTVFDVTPVLMFQWATVERRLVDSLGSHWRPKALSLIGVTLAGKQPATYVGVGADPGAPEGRPFFFMFGDTASHWGPDGPRHGWRMPVTFGQVDTLLAALRVVARDVTYRTLTVHGPAYGACLWHGGRRGHPNAAVSVGEVDSLPRVVKQGPLVFPPDALESSGLATLAFVIDTAGRADPASVCVVSSDDEAFTAAAIAVLKGTRYAPGTINGRPVRVLVQQSFDFHLNP